jgi:putative MATE family efflux protein
VYKIPFKFVVKTVQKLDKNIIKKSLKILEYNSLKSIWQNLVLAIRGEDIDYTTVKLKRAIFFLAIPMVLEMVMESVFVLVDIFFVAKLGSDAVAAVGLTETVITIVYAIAVGLTMAITAMVARRIGEKNPEQAAHTAVQAIYIGIAFSLPIAILGILFSKEILILMGGSESLVQTGYGYTTILIGGNVTIMLLFVINAVFRGAGDVILAMRSLWLANIFNIILDPCLIFGLGPFPELGVTGAAVATTIGRGLGVVFQLGILLKGIGRIKIERKHFNIDFKVIGNLLRISGGGVLQYLIATASWIGLVRIIAIFGSTVIAGYTIAIRIISFTFLPSWGIANAASTLVGQNLGAKNPERAEKAVWKIAFINLIFLAGISLFLILFPKFLVQFFTDELEIISYAKNCLFYIAVCYPFLAYGLVVVQAFNGAGDTYTPTLINLFCYWLFQIPLAYFLAVQLDLQANGVFIGIAISESMVAIAAILVFRRGKWKYQKI